MDHPVDYINEPFMGPIIDEAAVKAYKDYCGLCLSEGAEEILPLKDIQTKFKGHYVSPTIHYKKSIDKNTEFAKTEIFGPNTCIVPYSDFDQAIELVQFISDHIIDPDYKEKFLSRVEVQELQKHSPQVQLRS